MSIRTLKGSGKPSLPKVLTLALAVSGASQALAQPALEEIVVTAQFREQNLQQTPIAITGVSSEMLEARSQTNIAEVANQAPNVTLKPSPAAYGPSITASIRGVGQYDFNPAYEPGVGMYVDDVYFATLTGAVFDLLDLDRVEILRGPQGTLAGRNSIGGAVKLYSRKPAGDNSGMVEATYGIRNRLDLRANADFAITDNLFARVSGVSKTQDGYVDRIDYGCAHPESGVPALRAAPAGGRCVVAKEGEVDYSGLRAMLRWDDGGDITVDLIADYTEEDRTQSPSVLTAGNYQGDSDTDPFDLGLRLDSRFVPPSGSYYNYATYVNIGDENNDTYIADGRSTYQGWGLSAQVDWQLNDALLLESITAYRTYDSGFSNDNDLSPLAHSWGEGYLDFWSWSQEFRLSGTAGSEDQFDWTVGSFLMDQESVYGSTQDLRYSGLPAFWQDDPVTADTQAAFGHLNWYLSPFWTLVAGVRYTEEAKEYTFLRVTPEGDPHPTLAPLNGVTGEYEGDQVDYRLSLQYQMTDNVMTYAQIATGFKGGGINPRPFFATQVQPFDIEELTSYELGMKAELMDRRLRLNGAIFFSDYQDKQLTSSACPQFTPTPSGAPCALPINAGDAEMLGFEMEADLRLTDSLSIDGSLSWLDYEYQSINPLASDIDMDDVAPYTPEWKGSFGIQYEYFLDNGSSLTPRLDISYQGEMWADPSNTVWSHIDDYTLANARITWRSPDESWQASVEATNLTDEYYFLSKFEQYENNGIASGQPGRPFEWAFTVRHNFY